MSSYVVSLAVAIVVADELEGAALVPVLHGVLVEVGECCAGTSRRMLAWIAALASATRLCYRITRLAVL